MENSEEDITDGSSIKPVSSLRAQFENMLNVNKSSVPATPRKRSPAATDRLPMPEDNRRTDGRISLDIPREHVGRVSPSVAEFSGDGTLTPRARTVRMPWSNPKPRPTSMMAFSPPRSPTRSPPKVTVQSPKSPPKSSEPQIYSPHPSRPTSHAALDSPGPPGPSSNGAKSVKTPSRNTTPALDLKPQFPSHTTPMASADPRKGDRPVSYAPSVPPPVNRAGKPKIPTKSLSIDPSIRATLAPEASSDVAADVSPFSTPPSSSGGSTKGEPTPPVIPSFSKPKMTASKDGYFPPPPVHHAVAEKQAHPDPRASANWSLKTAAPQPSPSDMPDDRPALPSRREKDNFDLRKSVQLQRAAPPDLPVRRSFDQFRPAALVAEANRRFMPPPRRTHTTEGTSSTSSSKSLEPPKPPPPRNSGEMRRPAPMARPQASQPQPYTTDSDEEDAAPEKQPTTALTDYPDSSQANRRPPVFSENTTGIPTGYETKLFAICGDYICTTGYVTNVWNVLNGRLLMSLSHGDTVKATALAFRPAKDVEDEGKRLWLGTNTGEMLEIDIPTQSVVHTKSNAHGRSAIVKIFRYASEMWSIDDDGTLHVWPADDTGCPSLQQSPNTFRIPREHTFSMVSGSQLWVACTKEIRVYKRTGDNNHFQQITQGPLSQLNVGEVTSGAIVSSQPDRVYFGHTDGKVTVYSKKDFACLGIVNVSLYKISSLVGVGDNLWAGYSTGMIYVYDTKCTPWKVLKDWKAHEKPIAGIVADRTSIWKLDRFQVASLGTDTMLRIWDGMLKTDWLETLMQQRDAEYCDFRELSARVMTWNAGATKPTTLKHTEQDRNFFRELLEPDDPPDILVFGFQELVDLEDKKITAKSIFKRKKHKETSEHEHMSHQYRAWRDHLVRALDEYSPKQNYVLLHTANLVGLFTCVFIKASERGNVRDVCGAEIKLGFSGRVGNKGALVVRFFIDDSSLCFINCHLAAGQSQTVHRNNDAASIMENAPLPKNRSPSHCANFFVGGGDGSMILDHEICVLNGDLNYRIDAMPRNTVVAAVQQGNLAKLLERDQLLLSRKRNPGFRLRAFNEAPINFAPTYKYNVGTDDYDTSEKQRSPAWCDRLLYRGIGKIKQIDYRRHDGIKVSDHRPVSGRFKLRIKTINPKKQDATRDKADVDFEAVRRRIAGDIKLDYLINVFGLSTKEAQKLLKGA
ncbi:DNase I-like protein [Cucurbitaria berberidis CBS 394.84]|uniref:DNase I-like protein n=1 Tax=Cucurbitaria berberidis CBS 394.84 TaxID=1168544 RepID=A0A9P4GMF1_9PLEO|nr:DNase I-like protein [Cucurbitaria berberidis CBS 394.84]KAF1847887.1 DNase I-like protein [Cucurbitaria berberidis CBS 394.84]